jgi:hypothetical protein
LLLYDNDNELPADSSSHAAWPQYLIVIVAALTLSAYLAYALTWGIYLIDSPGAVGVVIYVTHSRINVATRKSRSINACSKGARRPRAGGI